MGRFTVVLFVVSTVASVAAAGVVEAPLAVRETADAAFTEQPEAVESAGRVRITFAVSAATDIEVAVLNAKGEVVRHLAAGLLGANAPAPLKANALKQELIWDRNDDLGKPAAGGPFKIRVRIGAAPRPQPPLGWDGNTLDLGSVHQPRPALLSAGQDRV